MEVHLHISLGDVVLSFFLAILAGLGVPYLWQALPKWANWIVGVWARRTDKARQKQLAFLEKELEIAQAAYADLHLFTAVCFRRLANVVKSAAAMLLGAIAAATILLSVKLSDIAHQIGLSSSTGDSGYPMSSSAANIAFLVFLFLVLRSIYSLTMSVSQLRKFSNKRANLARLTKSIEDLRPSALDISPPPLST
jgi:hypothetical protein